MTQLYRSSSSVAALLALAAATTVQAQVAMPTAAPIFAVAQASDTTLTCGQLAMEMVKTANVVASAATQATLAAATPPTVAPAQADMSAANALAGAINQAQLNNQLANLQMQAARAGINPGTSGAAIGGLAALAGAAASGQGAAEGAKQAAMGFAQQKLAGSIPGGALIGSLMGGMFGKKKKAVAMPNALIAATPAPSAQLVQLGQQRMAFLQSLSTSKSCM